MDGGINTSVTSTYELTNLTYQKLQQIYSTINEYIYLKIDTLNKIPCENKRIA